MSRAQKIFFGALAILGGLAFCIASAASALAM